MIKKTVARRPDFQTEVAELRKVLEDARTLYRFHNQTRRSLAIAFLKGTASALGAVVTVVIITPLIVLMLKTVHWPPIINNLISEVILQLDQANRPSPPVADGQ